MSQSELLVAPGISLSYSQDSGTTSYYTASSLYPTIDSPIGIRRFDSPIGIHRFQDDAQKIVIVMGPTGAGKSNFIKIATGNDSSDTDDQLISGTQDIRFFSCQDPLKGRDFLLVDSPGFNDTYKHEAEILDQIASWLLKAYQNRKVLAGVLYFHNITDNRMTNTRLRTLDTFKKMCGDDAYRSIRFVTTHWDGVTDDYSNILVEREGELCREYWKRFLAKGAETKRFDNTPASAWSIINSLSLDATVLQIQEEMGKKRLPLSRTKAGMTVVGWLDRAAESIRAALKRLRIIRLSARNSNDQIRQEFEREETRGLAMLREVETQQEYMNRV